MRVLVASQSIAGHALPLTGPARRLVERGHEVRWYAGESLRHVVEELGIELLPYRRAVEHTATNLNDLYPKRTRLKGPMQTRHDGDKLFAAPVLDFFRDIAEIRTEFPYDVVFLDASVYVSRPLRYLAKVPIVPVIGIANMKADPWVPPLWLGLRPDRSLRGRIRDRVLRLIADKLVSGPSEKTYRRAMRELGLTGPVKLIEDPYEMGDVVIQQGLEAFDFPRSRKDPNVHYVGPLLPWHPPSAGGPEAELAEHRKGFDRCVLITQGTIDTDEDKLIIPAIEAARSSTVRTLVLVTGGSATDSLRERFPGDDVVIEPRLDFTRVLDFVDVFVTNGGYGGVTLALTHGVPMVCAGVSEGKNDVIARADYHGVGIDLGTERPTVGQLRVAIERAATDPGMRARADAFAAEARGLDPAGRVADLVESVVAAPGDEP